MPSKCGNNNFYTALRGISILLLNHVMNTYYLSNFKKKPTFGQSYRNTENSPNVVVDLRISKSRSSSGCLHAHLYFSLFFLNLTLDRKTAIKLEDRKKKGQLFG